VMTHPGMLDGTLESVNAQSLVSLHHRMCWA
jgi:hypothetical protein